MGSRSGRFDLWQKYANPSVKEMQYSDEIEEQIVKYLLEGPRLQDEDPKQFFVFSMACVLTVYYCATKTRFPMLYWDYWFEFQTGLKWCQVKAFIPYGLMALRYPKIIRAPYATKKMKEFRAMFLVMCFQPEKCKNFDAAFLACLGKPTRSKLLDRITKRLEKLIFKSCDHCETRIYGEAVYCDGCDIARYCTLECYKTAYQAGHGADCKLIQAGQVIFE